MPWGSIREADFCAEIQHLICQERFGDSSDPETNMGVFSDAQYAMVEFARKYFRQSDGGERFGQLHKSTYVFFITFNAYNVLFCFLFLASGKAKTDKAGDPAEMIKFSKVVCTRAN